MTTENTQDAGVATDSALAAGSIRIPLEVKQRAGGIVRSAMECGAYPECDGWPEELNEQLLAFAIRLESGKIY